MTNAILLMVLAILWAVTIYRVGGAMRREHQTTRKFQQTTQAILVLQDEGARAGMPEHYREAITAYRKELR